jgi:hypothetical protein
MCINNIVEYIIDNPPAEEAGNVNAFTASTIIAIAFCKSKEEVISDILFAYPKIKKEKDK